MANTVMNVINMKIKENFFTSSVLLTLFNFSVSLIIAQPVNGKYDVSLI
jgi:hypothetical protein